MIYPFTVYSSNMLIIVTEQKATASIKKGMETVEQIGKTELQKLLYDNSKKVQKVCDSIYDELRSK